MSINPILAEDSTAKNALFPLPQPGEVFVLKREGMAFVASNSDRKLTGKGVVFLTSKRLVFLKDGKPENHKGFTSVELPLHLLSGSTLGQAPDFKQPIFGANYLEGKVEPAANATTPLAATTRWSLTFNKGGCQTFLKAFYRLHKRAVADPTNAGLDPVFAQQMQMGPQAAFYDPSDPSMLYLVQPVPQNAQPQPPPGQQLSGYQAQPPPPPAQNSSLYPSLDQAPQYYVSPSQPLIQPQQYAFPPGYAQQPQYCLPYSGAPLAQPHFAPQQYGLLQGEPQYQPAPQNQPAPPNQPTPQYQPAPPNQPTPQYQPAPQYAPYQPPSQYQR